MKLIILILICFSISINLTIFNSDDMGEYSWGIYEFPTDYSEENSCDDQVIGPKPIINFNDIFGKILLRTGGFNELILNSGQISLKGVESIWKRSLVLEGPSNNKICGTIISENSNEIFGEAKFNEHLRGSVWFTFKSNDKEIETNIFSNLFHFNGYKTSYHTWEIFSTEHFNSYEGSTNNCDFLQSLYNPENKDDIDCTEKMPEKCSQGNLTGKFGPVIVSSKDDLNSKRHFIDAYLDLSSLTKSSTSLFLVIYSLDTDAYYACSKIRLKHQKKTTASFKDNGINGLVTFIQKSPFYPVEVYLDLNKLDERADKYYIHEFPIKFLSLNENKKNFCERSGKIFNPFKKDILNLKSEKRSFDTYLIGDLSGKYGTLKNMKNLKKRIVDTSLSLYGRFSIVGRSISIYKERFLSQLTCSNIETDKLKITAEAKFTYPIVGRILFIQDFGDIFEDTSIFIESLQYSDGSRNITHNHRWQIHNLKPGLDYYNWTGRCLSTGEIFNPSRMENTKSKNYNYCTIHKKQNSCLVSDLDNKFETIVVVFEKINLPETKRFFTDSTLSLSGKRSILKKSLVILDDFAPFHRGNRMACTEIKRVYRHKAVATKWFGNGVSPPPFIGRLEFTQENELSITKSSIEFRGLNDLASTYHIHIIPVQEHLEFPCTNTAVGGHFNPLRIDPSSSPYPGNGTFDMYEIGDLSGKYGLLNGKNQYSANFNDTNLPLYGKNSILGRSIVVHKKIRAERWACASIEQGFDPLEAKEIRAIASFHHPNGFVWGYIKLKQVLYNDGSHSDTILSIRLKHPGKKNNKITLNHKWSIYVNPVGHDASTKHLNSRCSSAGYRWNPTFIQLSAPNDNDFYENQCGLDNPLRCEVGDLSGRHGEINIGEKAYIFNDINLPLHGDWYNSALGKSVVIHGPEKGTKKMACANIEEDKDITKFVNIKKKKGFDLSAFLENVRSIMGIPEWFLFSDSRFTKQINGGKCFRIKIHFAGPYTKLLEQDFNYLLRTGKSKSHSIFIPGHFHTSQKKFEYHECQYEHSDQSDSILNGINYASGESRLYNKFFFYPIFLLIILSIIIC